MVLFFGILLTGISLLIFDVANHQLTKLEQPGIFIFLFPFDSAVKRSLGRNWMEGIFASTIAKEIYCFTIQPVYWICLGTMAPANLPCH